DTRTGLTTQDLDVARRLRYADTPGVCVANNTDDQTFDSQADEIYNLGRGKTTNNSTMQNRGRPQLLDMIGERLPNQVVAEVVTPPVDSVMKVAIVGRRNVGKSTFVNTLAHAERMIVSEVAGTTRDSVDVRFELDGKQFIAIDTPGLKRTKSLATDVEF